MKRKGWLFILFLVVSEDLCFSQSVNIQYPKNSAPAAYATGMLKKALTLKKYTIKESGADFTIALIVKHGTPGPEAYIIEPATKKIIITGGDERGLIYGSL